MTNPIRRARDTRGWTSDRLNHELRRAAGEVGVTTAAATSLRVLISRWENGVDQPDTRYQQLLQKVFGLPALALGFESRTDAAGSSPIGALAVRDIGKLDVSDAILTYFRSQLAEHTVLDNVAGPGLVIGTASTQVDQLRILADRGPSEAMHLAARFAEFTGWLYQDSGDPSGALRYTDESVDLAESADDLALMTYNTMRKSNVLSAVKEHRRASVTARRAVDLAERHAPDLLPVCLRQVAIAEAGLRREQPARQALDRALELTAAEAVPNGMSLYCTTSYVEMEGALCLLLLGNPAAAEQACARALAQWPAGLTRDEALCLTRLAAAQLDQHNVDGACEAAMLAVQRVEQAPSARTLHMLQVIGKRVQPYKNARSVRELREALAVVA